MQKFQEISWLYEGLTYVLLGIMVLIISRIIIEKLTPYKVGHELVKLDNPALGVTLTGYYLGVIIIFLGAVLGDSDRTGFSGFVIQAGVDVLYAFLGIFLLNGCREIDDKMIL
jgi:uncharacterized membrane protein YjfL (UPF0719 family)